MLALQLCAWLVYCKAYCDMHDLKRGCDTISRSHKINFVSSLFVLSTCFRDTRKWQHATLPFLSIPIGGVGNVGGCLLLVGLFVRSCCFDSAIFLIVLSDVFDLKFQLLRQSGATSSARKSEHEITPERSNVIPTPITHTVCFVWCSYSSDTHSGIVRDTRLTRSIPTNSHVEEREKRQSLTTFENRTIRILDTNIMKQQHAHDAHSSPGDVLPSHSVVRRLVCLLLVIVLLIAILSSIPVALGASVNSVSIGGPHRTWSGASNGTRHVPTKTDRIVLNAITVDTSGFFLSKAAVQYSIARPDLDVLTTTVYSTSTQTSGSLAWEMLARGEADFATIPYDPTPAQLKASPDIQVLPIWSMAMTAAYNVPEVSIDLVLNMFILGRIYTGNITR
jgi:hypothetical protein